MKYLFLFAMSALPLLQGCNSPTAPYFKKEVDSLTKALVPDKREGICNVNIYIRGKNLILKGETDSHSVKDAFVNFLKKRNTVFTDSLLLLPDTALIKEPCGLVTISVCNIRSEASHDAEMVSQALMGTPLRILKYDDGWYLVQTPDRYLGWVDNDAVATLTESQYEKWKSSERVIWLESFGFVYGDKDLSSPVSDITAGSVVELIETDIKSSLVKLPDGRTGYVVNNGVKPFKKWAAESVPVFSSLRKSAFSLMGTPYLWGGTSAKGVDCSGFVKTAYFLNGMILARDVSLMFRHGKQIEDFRSLKSLEQGDLLFFGSVRNGKPRATHVGMYIGDSEFIHSSGMVRINSLDSTKNNFSRYRSNTFLGARRIIGEPPAEGMTLINANNWYF